MVTLRKNFQFLINRSIFPVENSVTAVGFYSPDAPSVAHAMVSEHLKLMILKQTLRFTQTMHP